MTDQLRIEKLWEIFNFTPDANQKAAILHSDGPLFLPAGPGSGKTSVLLWRTVHLIVFKNIKPEKIFLSTFTEKAARQLKVGLTNLLSVSSNFTGISYDIGRMYIGTLHSLCSRLLKEKRLAFNQETQNRSKLLDELGQYFFIADNSTWRLLFHGLSFGDALDEVALSINRFFGFATSSKHIAVTNLMSFYNRLSEELIDPFAVLNDANGEKLNDLLISYSRYVSALKENGRVPKTDFSLLQQDAYKTLLSSPNSASLFTHIIIDEYQDTNTIQEKIIFQLAEKSKNICVVGDDDQALYRFRGATVENLVNFPKKCEEILGCHPTIIAINTNYRSRKGIVDFYSSYMSNFTWTSSENPKVSYRVEKQLTPFRVNSGSPSVVVTSSDSDPGVCEEIADFVKNLIDQKIVSDPNQIAFLFPSLKTDAVNMLETALLARDLKVYAPRANKFLNVDEAVELFGVFSHIFGKLEKGFYPGRDYADYFAWLDYSRERAELIMEKDPALRDFVLEKQLEIEQSVDDYEKLVQRTENLGLSLKDKYKKEMKYQLLSGLPISQETRSNLNSKYFERMLGNESGSRSNISIKYALTRATSLDWTLLDLFYRILGFDHFRSKLDLAEKGVDEGPICNLSLISSYLSRFMDLNFSVLSASNLRENRLQRLLFGSFLYSLFRLGESEYEDENDPFPKGRIPFLTVHQAKGLEFPVVIFGNPRKRTTTPAMEQIVSPFITRDREPLSSMGTYDMMRLFYVAMSRAKELLIIPDWNSPYMSISQPLRSLIYNSGLPKLCDLEPSSVPISNSENRALTNTYSYTSDFQQYKKCPRQYMLFRKFDFSPSRSQTQFFGTLVHQTIEDLHQYILSEKIKNVQ